MKGQGRSEAHGCLWRSPLRAAALQPRAAMFWFPVLSQDCCFGNTPSVWTKPGTERRFLGCRGEEKKHLFSNNYRNSVKSIVRSTGAKCPHPAVFPGLPHQPALLAHSWPRQQSRYCFSRCFTGPRSDQNAPFLAAFPSFRVCLAMQNQVAAATNPDASRSGYCTQTVASWSALKMQERTCDA